MFFYFVLFFNWVIKTALYEQPSAFITFECQAAVVGVNPDSAYLLPSHLLLLCELFIFLCRSHHSVSHGLPLWCWVLPKPSLFNHNYYCAVPNPFSFWLLSLWLPILIQRSEILIMGALCSDFINEQLCLCSCQNQVKLRVCLRINEQIIPSGVFFWVLG